MIGTSIRKGLLIVAAALFSVLVVPVRASADVTEDGFVYEPNADGITITGYQGQSFDVMIPQSIDGMVVTEIGDEAFKGSTQIYSLSVGPDIRRIGTYAFSSSLISRVEIEEGQRELTVGRSAFSQADNLRSVSFSSRPTVLENVAFGYSDALAALEVPENVVLMSSVFAGCQALREVEMASSAVPKSTFYGCGALRKVVLEASVLTIEDFAFCRCESLAELTLSENLTEIGGNAFLGCTYLAEFILPNTIVSIGDGALSECSKITSLFIPASLTNMPARNIRDLTGMSILQVDEGNPVYCAENNVLYDKEMTEAIAAAPKARGDIVLPDTVVNIQERAFYGCSRIESVLLPDSLISIGGNAFSSCTSLTRIVVPDSVQGVLNGTFAACSSLTYAEVGQGVYGLDGTFSGCSELTEIKLTENITDIGMSSFLGCVKLENFRIPSGVTRLGGWDFYQCESLKQLEMPKGLTYVGFRSLQYCSSLESLTFYENLNQVSDIWYAMADNENLQYVLFHGPYVKLSENVFVNMNPNFVIFRREQYPQWDTYTQYPVVTATDAMLALKENLGALSVADTRITDKERLLGYKGEYESLNYLEQRLYLDWEVDTLQECLNKIEALEVGVRIDALPDAGQLKPEDKTIVRGVETDYNALGVSKQAYLKASQKLRLNRILIALGELLAVKGIALGAPAQAADGSYTLSMAVGEEQIVPVTITPDYAEDRKLDVQSDGQDKIVSAKIQDGEEEVRLTALDIGTANVAVSQRSLFEASLDVLVVLAAPQNMKAGQQGAGAVALSWDRSRGADYYEIYRKTGKDGEEELTGKTLGNVGIYVDKGLEALTSYTYRVIACSEEDEKYNSTLSQSVQVTLDSSGAVHPSTPTPSPKPTVSPTPGGSQTPVASPTPGGSQTLVVSPTPRASTTPGTSPSQTVTPKPTTTPKASIRLNYSSLALQKGKSTTAVKIKSSVPAKAAIASAKSNKPSVAAVKVKNGKLTITGKKVGTAQITIVGSNQAKAKVKILVKKKVNAQKLTLSKKKATLKKGRKLTLKVTKTPVTATDKVTWTSSNKKVATVTSKGVVKAKKKGTAVIRVKTSGGKKATCKITVN